MLFFLHNPATAHLGGGGDSRGNFGWGNLLNTTTSGTTNANNLANNNPLRYRGYIYDNETGLYYLQSRYYDPEVGRFLNADGYVSTGQGLLGCNTFAYCQNSPVSYFDPDGNRIVGVGVQGEITIGGISVGVELVVYFDPEVCNGSDFSIVMYTYSGYELSADQLDRIMALVDVYAISSSIDSLYGAYGETDFLTYFESTALAQVLHGIFSDGGSATAAFFIIDGFENFDGPEDYSGKFVSGSFSGSVNGKTGGVYYSRADTCQAVGAKYGYGFEGAKSALPSPMKFSFSYSVTYYSSPYILYEG